MRGKACFAHRSTLPSGITPAYAGKSTKQEKHRDKARDHPRVCGEKHKGGLPAAQKLGSPPRMRGKVVRLPLPAVGGRITPAYAGKSSVIRNCKQLTWDHPRVCGEKKAHHLGLMDGKGSPPRMRGKDMLKRVGWEKVRITPAYAGKSAGSSLQCGTRWDHPRVCGEKTRRLYCAV